MIWLVSFDHTHNCQLSKGQYQVAVIVMEGVV
jgi:hypothetical protein